MTAPGTPQLDYANQAPLHRRRWVQHSLLLTACLIAVLVVRRWGDDSIQRSQIQYWQNQCLNYDDNGEKVMYEDHLASPAVEWGDGHVTQFSTIHNYAGPALSRTVKCWDRLAEFTHLEVAPDRTDGLVFLHRRKDSSGNERLVALRIVMRAWNELTFEYWTLTPQTKDRLLGQAWYGRAMVRLPPGTDSQKLRLFAGKPDSIDATHFTIGYDLGAKSGTIDAWVKPAGGEDIQMSIR